MLRSPAIFIDLCSMGVTRWLVLALGPSLLPSSILCCDARDENIFVDSHFQSDHGVLGFNYKRSIGAVVYMQI